MSRSKAGTVVNIEQFPHLKLNYPRRFRAVLCRKPESSEVSYVRL